MGRDTGSVWAAAKDGWRGILCTEMDPITNGGSLWCHVNVRGRTGKRARRPGCSQPLGHSASSPALFPAPHCQAQHGPLSHSRGSCPGLVALLAPGGNLCQAFTARAQGDQVRSVLMTRDTGRRGKGAWMFERLGQIKGCHPLTPLPPPVSQAQVPSPSWGLAGTVH